MNILRLINYHYTLIFGDSLSILDLKIGNKIIEGTCSIKSSEVMLDQHVS